ncbi:hypothetical protein ACMYYO_04620 [Dermacoccaceae bacterium W4C1]
MTKARRYWASARKASQYLLLPAVGFLSPLLVIPVVTSEFGAAGWAAMAIAQSLGMAFSVATELGWGVVGPQRIAGLPRDEAVQEYRLSITSRTLTVLPGGLIAAAAAALLVHDHHLDAAVLAFGTAAQGMTPSWYFIGLGQPIKVFLSEGVPRVLVAVIASVIMWQGGPLLVYGLLMTLTVPLAQLLARRFIGRDARPGRAEWRSAPSVVRSQMTIGLGRIVSVTYTALPISIVGLFAPSAVPVFAATERLMRMCVQVLGVVPLRLQSWIGVAQGRKKMRRIRTAQQIGLGLGLTAGVSYALLAPIIAPLIFRDDSIRIPFHVAAASGLLLCVICVSTSLGLSLVAVKAANKITWAIIPSACVGLLLIGPTAFFLGAVGAVLGEIAAEATGAGLQRRSFLRSRRGAA